MERFSCYLLPSYLVSIVNCVKFAKILSVVVVCQVQFHFLVDPNNQELFLDLLLL